jgi:hypothetical protein
MAAHATFGEPTKHRTLKLFFLKKRSKVACSAIWKSSISLNVKKPFLFIVSNRNFLSKQKKEQVLTGMA